MALSAVASTSLSNTARIQKTALPAHLVMAPLKEKTVLQHEENYLEALECLYEDDSPRQIAYAYYHQPIMMTAAEGDARDQIIEAWAKSGLYYDYNLVLLNSDQQVLQHPALDNDMLARLALYSHDQVAYLQGGITHYLYNQEPHIYLATHAEDPHLLTAMEQGFLTCSQCDLPGLISGENGFRVSGDSALALAKDLVNVLEGPRSDWELLHHIGLQGRELRMSTLAEVVVA